MSTTEKPQSSSAPKPPHNHDHDHDHKHAHVHENGHDHTHSHGIFGHSHAAHDHDHSEDAERVMQALSGKGDRGSQITLVGLFTNVGLTAAKGIAGWQMHSASLLADAGHSLSDLLGDFVTLFCWKLSRKPPSLRYPYGFAKFETLGTTMVSLMLIGGALGIGFHSWHLLVESLSSTVPTMSPGPLRDFVESFATAADNVPVVGHAHGHGDVLDPNAAWFALVSVVAKEWLYRITKKVADDENSPVLYANAIHHRSDAYSSVVALAAILGSWFFPAVPLDPIGGLVVSIIIFQQGLGLFGGAFADLTDAGVSATSHRAMMSALEQLVSKSADAPLPNHELASQDALLLGIRNLRAKRAGSLVFVDVTIDVPGSQTILATTSLQETITRTLKEARKEVSAVNVTFNPVKENDA
ncbi:cation efflux protein [Coniophora puteana RWD-64-598 SS2]|uniref:Cation efflux protein n=1 Tax=Coniophora puteana (strain RWD-64-598) TaxID=741705 RepID=A0A5M3MX19_CONPW|nr:cation efflux protein [Coniophora puteana RWD-64-598 SS2]EIW83161.1 cation efflux protein [Coniophora puteana RWD-64-598 SS2]